MYAFLMFMTLNNYLSLYSFKDFLFYIFYFEFFFLLIVVLIFIMLTFCVDHYIKFRRRFTLFFYTLKWYKQLFLILFTCIFSIPILLWTDLFPSMVRRFIMISILLFLCLYVDYCFIFLYFTNLIQSKKKFLLHFGIQNFLWIRNFIKNFFFNGNIRFTVYYLSFFLYS